MCFAPDVFTSHGRRWQGDNGNGRQQQRVDGGTRGVKTVKDACVLQPNALSIKLSDQVEQLDELITAEGDGSAFFERTAVTGGMKDLFTEGLSRLAGESSQAVFHLKQAMGGGKTHLLVGFGLLARHPELRARYAGWVTAADRFDTADVAAFNGRNSPAHFFWGEIADQLGRGAEFAPFWSAGPKAPDESDWLRLFEGDRPILVLLDEMPPYFQYLTTQKVGDGTVADIVTRAFANMLSAAGRKRNVCVVVSDLAAAYEVGGQLIQRALEHARSELGRQERTITPVDLSTNEVYQILRKRLFISLPDTSTIDDVSSGFARKLEEASRSKTASRGAESIADEIAATYPFHPRLKNVIALFKENDQFKQTRGLIELVSRLLRSVWERPDNDVFLIGAQHFDLAIPEVREKLTEISGLRDVIARDLWDEQQGAFAQMIDLRLGKGTAREVGALLFTASLSTAVNAVRGLTREELVECLTTPLREPSDYLAAFDELEQLAWYLHHTPEGRYYFDRQENLTKLLQSLAKDAPQNLVDDLVRDRLSEMFAPTRRAAYTDVLSLPRLADVADRVRQARVLVIASPDSKMPPEEVARFFDGLTEKNNLLVLSGEKSAMASLEEAARQHFAAQKADTRIPAGHPQREDLERKQQDYARNLRTTILSLFDKVLFPRIANGQAILQAKALEPERDTSKPYDGEAQIELTLASMPQKLYLDIEAAFDILREKAQELLWPVGAEDTRWADSVDRYAQQAGMPWVPPKGLDALKSIACNRGLWEDLGTGYVTKKPKPKVTSAQFVAEPMLGDDGRVRLTIQPQNGGPSPEIHFAEDGPVSDVSPLLREHSYETTALRVRVLVRDPSGQYLTGDPVEWCNELVLRNRLDDGGSRRRLELLVAPKGSIRYTVDGSEPRDGTPYTGAFEIGDEEVLVRAFAEADGLETKTDFRFAARGRKDVVIDLAKPATFRGRTAARIDDRGRAFAALADAKVYSASFEDVTLAVGQGAQILQLTIGQVRVEPAFVEDLLTRLIQPLPPDAPVTLTFRRASFTTGHDLKEFAERHGIELKPDSVEQ